MTHVFRREQLFEIVWSEPIQKVAKSLEISDVALAKACRRAGIPVPERGYWAKLQAGKQVERPRLLPRAFGSNGNVEIGLPGHGSRWPPGKGIPGAPVAPFFPEPIEEIRERA